MDSSTSTHRSRARSDRARASGRARAPPATSASASGLLASGRRTRVLVNTWQLLIRRAGVYPVFQQRLTLSPRIQHATLHCLAPVTPVTNCPCNVQLAHPHHLPPLQRGSRLGEEQQYDVVWLSTSTALLVPTQSHPHATTATSCANYLTTLQGKIPVCTDHDPHATPTRPVTYCTVPAFHFEASKSSPRPCS